MGYYDAFEFPVETEEEVEEIGLMESADKLIHFPLNLVFYLPKERGYLTIPLSEDHERMYRQLVCWCNYARFWYYVIGESKFRDMEYDYIERLVANLEKETGMENPYSPTLKPGSNVQFNYPFNIREDFFGYEK